MLLVYCFSARHCPDLEQANLVSFRVDVPSLERLCRSCPRLAGLSLPDRCDDACVETVLRGLPRLRSLAVFTCRLSGRCLASLPASLRRLGLIGDWNISPAALDRAARCPQLAELSISGLHQAPPAELLAVCPRLQRLMANSAEVTDSFLQQLPARTPHIRNLYLQG